MAGACFGGSLKSPIRDLPAIIIPMTALTAAQLARLIDFPLHRPDATAKDVEQHCAIAREHHFAAVAVNSSYVVHVRHFLEDSDVKVVAAIGFPLGGTDGDTKRYE